MTTHLRLQVQRRKETLLQVSWAPNLPIGDLKVFIVGLSRILGWEVGVVQKPAIELWSPWILQVEKKKQSRIKHGKDGIRLSLYLNSCQLFHLFKAFSVNSSCAGRNTRPCLSYLVLLQKPFWIWFSSLFLLPCSPHPCFLWKVPWERLQGPLFPHLQWNSPMN